MSGTQSERDEAVRQAEAIATLIDEADDDVERNGLVSRDELAKELLALETEWQQAEHPVVSRVRRR